MEFHAHVATHLPYSEWCDVCARGRGLLCEELPCAVFRNVVSCFDLIGPSITSIERYCFFGTKLMEYFPKHDNAIF